MRTAFLFPGQGTEIARTGPPWLERSAEVRRLLDAAARHLAHPAARLFAEGGRHLQRTEVQQPVLTALCLGIHLELGARGVRPDVVAGYSLGEVAAVAAAGAMDAETAVAVAALRGRLMEREAARHPGGMLALSAAARSVAEDALALARANGLAALAAHNAPGQWVVAGEWSALRAVAARFPTMPVPVAGPWHTDAMVDAVAEYLAELREATRGPLRATFVCNRTGGVVSDAGALPELLAAQCTHPVEWHATLQTLGTEGVTDVVVVGPGKMLRGLVRRTLGAAVALHAAELPEDLDRIREALAR